MLTGFQSWRGTMAVGEHLRTLYMTNRSMREQTSTDTGVIRQVNADGTYNVEVRNRGQVLTGLSYIGAGRLMFGTTVTLMFISGDRQKIQILGPATRHSNSENVLEVDIG